MLKFDPFGVLTKIKLGPPIYESITDLVVFECKQEEKGNLFLSSEKNPDGIIIQCDDGDVRIIIIFIEFTSSSFSINTKRKINEDG